jgi:hypothetical protein
VIIRARLCIQPDPASWRMAASTIGIGTAAATPRAAVGVAGPRDVVEGAERLPDSGRMVEEHVRVKLAPGDRLTKVRRPVACPIDRSTTSSGDTSRTADRREP